MYVSVVLYRLGAEALPMNVHTPCTCKLSDTSNEWAMATPVLEPMVIINWFVDGGTVDDTANCNPKVWDNTPDEYNP